MLARILELIRSLRFISTVLAVGDPLYGAPNVSSLVEGRKYHKRQ